MTKDLDGMKLGISPQGACALCLLECFSLRLLQHNLLSFVVFQHVCIALLLVAQIQTLMIEPGLLPTPITQSFLKHLRNGHKL